MNFSNCRWCHVQRRRYHKIKNVYDQRQNDGAGQVKTAIKGRLCIALAWGDCKAEGSDQVAGDGLPRAATRPAGRPGRDLLH